MLASVDKGDTRSGQGAKSIPIGRCDRKRRKCTDFLIPLSRFGAYVSLSTNVIHKRKNLPKRGGRMKRNKRILLAGCVALTVAAQVEVMGMLQQTACAAATEAEVTEAEAAAWNEMMAEAEQAMEADVAEVTEESHEIADFPLVLQMPELPTGCEITAMTMVLQYYGLDADKVEMATEYLPTLARTETYIGADGRKYGNDMERYFIGDPTTEGGIICGTTAIVTAANAYLEANGSTLRAEDMSGISTEDLYRLVQEDIPVVVWCTIGMGNRMVQDGWYTEYGAYVDWARNDHGAVLIGYDTDTVTIADPISGIVAYDRAQFESVFASRGNRCVILAEQE